MYAQLLDCANVFYIIFKNRFNKAEIAMQENGVVTLMNKNAG
jgi:hypothetical protein